MNSQAASSPTQSNVDEAEQASADAELTQLIQGHSAAVFRFAKSIVREPKLAEDVVEETMVKAWQELPSFTSSENLRNRILKICYETSSALVSSGAVPESSSVSGPGGPESDPTSRAMEQLDKLSRSIVVLSAIEKISEEDIAEILDVKRNIVKAKLLRSRAQLSGNTTVSA